jgi:predicted phosphate transport protein (TIGR00153 family)
MPRERRFFELFNRHARTLVGGAVALREMLEGGDAVPAACGKIVDYEHEADQVVREVLLHVRRTFITPFDRGDISDLINSQDDAIDQMQKTAKAITLFEVRSFEPQMRALGDIIVQAAHLTVEAVGLLGDMHDNATRLNAITEQVTRIEEQADDVNDDGIKALYRAHRDGSAMGYIVGAEIYDHLEKVVDRFEDVANRINGIVIEQV